MKKFLFSLGLGLAVGLAGCGESSQVETTQEVTGGETAVVEAPETEVPETEVPDEEASMTGIDTEETDEAAGEFPVEVSTYTSDALFEAGGGGCGMSLWNPDESFRDGLLFFHGLGDEPALMLLDGSLQALSRTAGSGEAFYGQQSEQTFETDDGAISVQVSVTLGDPGEIESVEISDGEITVEAKEQRQEIPVIGDAGC